MSEEKLIMAKDKVTNMGARISIEYKNDKFIYGDLSDVHFVKDIKGTVIILKDVFEYDKLISIKDKFKLEVLSMQYDNNDIPISKNGVVIESLDNMKIITYIRNINMEYSLTFNDNYIIISNIEDLDRIDKIVDRYFYNQRNEKLLDKIYSLRNIKETNDINRTLNNINLSISKINNLFSKLVKETNNLNDYGYHVDLDSYDSKKEEDLLNEKIKIVNNKGKAVAIAKIIDYINLY